MYTAKIIDVKRTNNEIAYQIEFSNGEKTFINNYSFSLAQDIDNVLPLTIEYEKQRLLDLDIKFETEVERIGEVI